jgi:hypothetical protein
MACCSATPPQGGSAELLRAASSSSPPSLSSHWAISSQNTPDLGSKGLNQYWYSQGTVAALCSEIEAHVGGGSTAVGATAFLSTPSLFFAVSAAVRERSTLFEYDDRWCHAAALHGGRFVRYDYKEPLGNLDGCEGKFDLLVIDPPFIDRKVWTAFFRSAARLLAKDGELLLTTVAERQEDLVSLVQALPQAAGRAAGWGLRKHRFVPINCGCAHQFVVFSTLASTTFLDCANLEQLPECIVRERTSQSAVNGGDGDDDDDDGGILLGVVARDAMLAISCEPDTESDDEAAAHRCHLEHPENLVAGPEPAPELALAASLAEAEAEAEATAVLPWSRNQLPFAERFVRPLCLEGLPGPGAVGPMRLLQSAGDGPDSDGQVTVWDAALVLHQLLRRAAAAAAAAACSPADHDAGAAAAAASGQHGGGFAGEMRARPRHVIY